MSTKDVLKVETNTVFNKWFPITKIIINRSLELPLASLKKAGKVTDKGRRENRVLLNTRTTLVASYFREPSSPLNPLSISWLYKTTLLRIEREASHYSQPLPPAPLPQDDGRKRNFEGNN